MICSGAITEKKNKMVIHYFVAYSLWERYLSILPIHTHNVLIMVIYRLPKPTQPRSLIWGIWVAWATGWLLGLTAILVCLLTVLLVQSVSWSCIHPRTIEEWTYLLTYLHHYTQAKWQLQYLVDCCYWWLIWHKTCNNVNIIEMSVVKSGDNVPTISTFILNAKVASNE